MSPFKKKTRIWYIPLDKLCLMLYVIVLLYSFLFKSEICNLIPYCHSCLFLFIRRNKLKSWIFLNKLITSLESVWEIYNKTYIFFFSIISVLWNKWLQLFDLNLFFATGKPCRPLIIIYGNLKICLLSRGLPHWPQCWEANLWRNLFLEQETDSSSASAHTGLCGWLSSSPTHHSWH